MDAICLSNAVHSPPPSPRATKMFMLRATGISRQLRAELKRGMDFRKPFTTTEDNGIEPRIDADERR